MAGDSFYSRIPTLPDAGLQEIVDNPLRHRSESVEAAAAELGRRGRPLGADEWRRIRGALERRDAAADASVIRQLVGMLGSSFASRMSRLRLVTACLLAAGLGSATVLYLTAAPEAGNPLGYEPADTKKYLRELELYGGKANVLAAELTRWLDGLWHGRPLAFTVGSLTVVLAFAFWLACTRQARDLDASERERPEGGGPEGA